MEEKIISLIYLAKKFNETEEEDVSFSEENGMRSVYVMGDEYIADTYNEALDKALKTIKGWLEYE